MDQFWRDKIKDQLLNLKQRLEKGCVLNWKEVEILKLLVDVKLEVLNLNAFPDLTVQMDFKLEQILKREMSGLKTDEDRLWPLDEVDIKKIK